MSPSKSHISDNKSQSSSLKYLSSHQVQMIDEALGSLGEFGEVRLIIEKGRLRFLVTQRSFDALKWRPGSIGEESA